MMVARMLPVLIAAVATLAGCVIAPQPPADFPRIASYAMAEAAGTTLAREVAPVAALHPGKSGFQVLERGEEALLWRGALADRAEATIDAQYYIWNEDNVGTIAAERLLRAAERGVRVRVLVDDLSIATDPGFLAMLDAHPRVEIRMYNPTGFVGRDLMPKALAVIGDFYRLNRRMHNKALVVDGALAVIGGRNVADEYYDMHREFNFRDRDVLVAGPIVADIEASFDRYWNSTWAVPVAGLARSAFTDAEREAYYARLHAYVADPAHFPPRFGESLAALRARMPGVAASLVWGPARLVYDIPGKNEDPDRLDAFGTMGWEIAQAASGAAREILAETPYLAVMPGTLDVVRSLHERGVAVRILTNSLASTDNLFAFSRYAEQRETLLRLGVRLHELMPQPAFHGEIVERLPRMATPARLALHAKTMVIDRRIVFIGSFNMDPRSTHLNTELGVLIESPELAARLAAQLERDMAPENSFELSLDPVGRGIAWTWVEDGRRATAHADPGADPDKLFQVRLYRLLPLDKLI
jgi:putative cardiolipin synthase